MTINLDDPLSHMLAQASVRIRTWRLGIQEGRALPHTSFVKLLHKALQILGSLEPSDSDHSTVNRLPILILPAVEEGVPLFLGHGQDSFSLTFVLPFLRPSADRLTGEFGDSGGVAGVSHAEAMARRGEERAAILQEYST